MGPGPQRPGPGTTSPAEPSRCCGHLSETGPGYHQYRMPTVAEMLNALSQQAHRDQAAFWDRHGLQLGDPDDETGEIGVCHEVTTAVVEAAIEARLGLLITYHPLLFHPLIQVVAGSGPGGRAFRLLRAGVAVATFHTAWDAARGGTADSLAKKVGLRDYRAFAPIDPAPRVKLVTFVPPDHVDDVAADLAAAGAGRVGNYAGCGFRSEGVGTFLPGPGANPVVGRTGTMNVEKEVRLEMVADKHLEPELVAALIKSHPYEEPAFDVYDVRASRGMVGRVGELGTPLSLAALAAAVGRSLSTPTRVAGAAERVVERVAVIPGAGGSLVAAAASTRADALVTGDVSHHQTVEAIDLDLAVIDPGHAATERPGVAALRDAVGALHAGVVDLTADPTPWTNS